ncbi:MAG: SGNH/GDSL hydrolase family protein, partial [Alphaproteobacteria bacterium]
MYAKRLLLMGDSIIDNGAYVQPGEPDVAEQVRKLMPEFDVEKRAIDGSVTTDVTRTQLHELQDTDLIVLSTIGNDALLRADLLNNIIH